MTTVNIPLSRCDGKRMAHLDFPQTDKMRYQQLRIQISLRS